MATHDCPGVLVASVFQKSRLVITADATAGWRRVCKQLSRDHLVLQRRRDCLCSV